MQDVWKVLVNSIFRWIIDVAVQCRDCCRCRIKANTLFFSGQTSKEICEEVAGSLIGLNW